jgi:hypothetical protein
MYRHPWRLWQPIWSVKGSRRMFWYVLGILILAMAIPYSVINHIMGNIGYSAMDPSTSYDEKIPFIGWSFFVYLSLYLYYPAAAWFGRTTNERIREMLAFHQALFIMTWIVFAIFIIFPTEIHIRDNIPTGVRNGEGFWGFWYGDLMHKTDMPFNAWPSLHVAQSLLIVLLLRKWGVINKGSEVIVWICWVGLCLSVLTTKQHFIFDLVTGLIAAILTWRYMCVPAIKSTNDSTWLEKFPN